MRKEIRKLPWEERVRLYKGAMKIREEKGWGYVRIGRERKQYRVIYHSYYLHEFLKKPFNQQRQCIEAYPAEFIRGFSDSEGGPKVSTVYWKHLKWLSLDIGITSTNKDLLKYVQTLLRENFSIFSILKPNHRKGTEFVINNKVRTRTQDAYELVVGRIGDIEKYSQSIGFTINEKQEKLNDAIRIFEKHRKPPDRVAAWVSSYEKIRNKWVKKVLYPNDSILN